MFLSADLAVYGRYGSRNASGPASDALLSAAGFRAAAERALKLHAGFPANKAELAGKVGPPSPYKRPTEIPGLTEKPARATVRQECIHCHMVKEYALRAKWEAGKLSKDDLFVFPQPTNIGLTMKLEDGAVVQSVAPGSAAAAAGLAAGDELVSLGGQPVISLADIQWVLNGAKHTSLPVVFRRTGEQRSAQIKLSGDWKRSDIAWRASSWYGLRQGVKTEPLTAEEKTARGLPADSLALVVKLLAGKGGPKVQAAGLHKDDLIIAVDGQSKAMSESEFLVHLRLNHGPMDAVKLTVLRGSERKELLVPLW
jgi:predicted metalloprotease with PDZ domain